MITSAAVKKILPAIVYVVMISLVTSGLGFLFFFDVPTALAQPHVAEGDAWGVGVDGGSPAVYAIAHSGNIAYIGGSFSYVGPYTGPGVSFDASGNLRSGFPFVSGVNANIYTSVSDGSGGWYIVGDFSKVGGVARAGLAHILSDGTLDSSWNPAPDNAVSEIAVSGSDIYVGGSFTTIGGQSRNYLAKLNNTNGDADATWDPNPDDRPYAIAASGSDIYVGGGFTTIGGQSRSGLAKLNNTNGNADATWDPNPTMGGFDGQISTVAINGSDIYVSGSFDTIGGQARNYLAKLNNTNGDADPVWDPSPSGGMMGSGVAAFAFSGSTIYVGGMFTMIGGQSRNNIAALNNTSGAATAWDPDANDTVYALTISGSTIYVGGDFTTIGGQSRKYLAVLSSITGLATSWDPNPLSRVNSISVSGSDIYVGGEFSYIGGVTRNNIAAINITTGRPTAWNPNSDGYVKSLLLDGSTLYAGGGFSNIGGQARNQIAALDTGTGNATAWDPSASGGFNGVLALALSGSNVYAGGDFTSIGGQARNRIAALDTGTGLATAWDPSATSGGWPPARVSTITISGSTVYAGGTFTSIGGQARNNIAALDITTGAATAWDPNATGGLGFPDPIVGALIVSGSTVYAGGQFTNIGGQARNRIAALDAATGLATAWNPNSDGYVYALTLSGGTLYVGGSFKTIGGQSRLSLAIIDTGTGLATSWNPAVTLDCTGCMVGGPPPYAGDVRAIAVGSPVLAGGAFYTPTSGGYVRGFAQFGSSPKMSDTLTRLKVSTAANHTIKLTLGEGIDWDAGDTLTLTLESDFNLGALNSADPLDYDINTGVEETIVANGGCGASDAIEITSIAAQIITFTACGSYTPPGANATIVIQIGTNATTGGTGDSQITNPTVAGSYTVDFAGSIGDSNSCMVAIVNDDSVIITATVDPTFTFIISSPNCALGTLLTSTVSTCNYYVAVGTNATSGAVITIRDIDDGDGTTGLDLDSNPATALTNVLEDGTVGPAGIEEYGIAVAGGSAWYEQGDFTDDDTPIPTALTVLVNTPGPVADTVANRTTVTHRASISVTSPAGTYSQAVEYIATGTF